MKYCSQCGHELTSKIPPGDDRLRHVCTACGMVHYQNPKVVVGCIPRWEEQILICRRDIEPRSGYWTLPAGYLENGETLAAGAVRETREETGAEVTDLSLYRIYDIVHVNQVYIMFLATLKAPTFHPTIESSEVKLISPGRIPWDELAFPVITQTLQDFVNDQPSNSFSFANKQILQRLNP
jgi:ADP-ribose pyrophosphatase YjhB (NUDIX family)